MIQEYKRYYHEKYTPQRYRQYQNDFKKEVGKLYALSTGPYFLKKTNATKIKEAILPSIIHLLSSKKYQESVYQRGWFLPKIEVKKSDFFGSADFHIDGDEIRLIELNFFMPGHFGLIELFPKLFAKSFNFELEIFTDGFERRLADFLKKRFDGDKIALCVNHLGRSEHYLDHYRYIENFLNKNGLNAKVVYAKDAGISDNNRPMWDNEEYDGVFNIVIPRNWEHNKDEFLNYTTLFEKIPEYFFPNPWCWTIGDKRFLNTLANLDNLDYGLSKDDEIALKSITLKSAMVNSFSNTQELYSFFGNSKNFVLKPIDNYHTEGVYINPSAEIIEKIIKEEADFYIVQEYFEAESIYYEDENGKQIEPYKGQLRVEFFNGEFLNFRTYGFSNPFGLSPMMPVAIR